MTSSVRQNVVAGLPARDHLQLELTLQDGEILEARLEVIGCMELLKLAEKWRPLLIGKIDKVPIPGGRDHASILMRELILKAQGRWKFPYEEEELCHCRGIPTAKVDAAIISGCHTLEAIRAATSANTSCGTCRPDVESVLEYRLKAGVDEKD